MIFNFNKIIRLQKSIFLIIGGGLYIIRYCFGFISATDS